MRYYITKPVVHSADFGFLDNLAAGITVKTQQGIRKLGTAIQNRQAIKAAKKAQKAVQQTASRIPDGHVMTSTGVVLPKANMLDKAFAVGGLASIPLTVGSLAIPSADTRAVEAMRKQDAAREAKGLKPLAMTPQLIAEQAQKAKNAVSNTIGDIRTTLPTQTPQIPPLPPNSMRNY